MCYLANSRMTAWPTDATTDVTEDAPLTEGESIVEELLELVEERLEDIDDGVLDAEPSILGPASSPMRHSLNTAINTVRHTRTLFQRHGSWNFALTLCLTLMLGLEEALRMDTMSSKLCTNDTGSTVLKLQ